MAIITGSCGVGGGDIVCGGMAFVTMEAQKVKEGEGEED